MSAGCGIFPTNPDAGLPVEDLVTDPRPAQNPREFAPAIGPVIEIASGNVKDARFAVVAYQSARGACIGTRWANSEGMACGPEPGAADGQSCSFGLISEDDDPFISVTVGADLGGVGAIHGFVDERVESVSARADDGTPYDVPVIRSGLAGSAAGLFVILYPSTESIVSITAYGADGAALKLRDVR